MKTRLDDCPGTRIPLTLGHVHYEHHKGREDRTVVFICGISKPYYVWEFLWQKMKDLGLSLLRYDHYGRGWSDRPVLRYDHALFDRCLTELLDKLEINKIDTVSLSMGTLVAARYALQQPERVGRMCVMDGAGFPRRRSLGEIIMGIPWLGERLWARRGRGILLGRNKYNVYKPERFPDYDRDYQVQMDIPGFLRAIHSTMKYMDFQMTGDLKRLGAMGKETCLIWGEEDAILPIERHRYFMDHFKKIDFYPVPDAGHEVCYEKPEECFRILKDFLK